MNAPKRRFLIVIVLSSFGTPATVRSQTYSLEIGYELPANPNFVYDARALEAKCLTTRNTAGQACANGTDKSKCEQNEEISFRRCISSIPHVTFQLGICPKAGCEDHSLEPHFKFPIPAQQATDPYLNIRILQLRNAGWYRPIGVRVDLRDTVCEVREESGNSKVRFSDQEWLCLALGNYRENSSLDPLPNAIDKDQYGLAEFLLSRGTEVQFYDIEKAIFMHRPDFLKLLVEYGGDVNSRAATSMEETGRSVVDYGGQQVEIPSGFRSVKTSTGTTLLQLACREGDFESVRFLLARGADVSAKGQRDETALHWAASAGAVDVSELLISRGADVNATTSNGQTPLHDAAAGQARRERDKELAEEARLLLSKGARVNAKDNYGSTPLHLAVNWGRTAVVKVLVSNGADTNARDNKNKTPADYVTKFDSEIEAYLHHH